MQNNILYFPYISLPNNEWSIKSILYWDTIGTIVPSEFIRHPEQLTKFMKEAVQTGHIIQHVTSDYEYIQQRVDQNILREIHNPAFGLAMAQNNFRNGLTSRIHFQKFSWNLLKNWKDSALLEGKMYGIKWKIKLQL